MKNDQETIKELKRQVSFHKSAWKDELKKKRNLHKRYASLIKKIQRLF